MQEANLHGYGSLKDWYVDHRSGGQKLEDSLLHGLTAEFAQLENRNRSRRDESDDEQQETSARLVEADARLIRESQACTTEAEAALA
eukprot:688368-Karenia_brevis.AAC.1